MIILDINTTTLNFTNEGGTMQFKAFYPNADYIYVSQTTGGS